jgi:hypothetical protein
MSGGITQLVAVGAQDAFIVGNPEVSFFQSTYKRHTNFSQTVERQLMQGNPVANAMTTVRFDRKGDLLGYVYIAATDGSFVNWEQTIDSIELYIGGQLIDTQYYEFSNLTTDILATSDSKSSLSVLTNFGNLNGTNFFPIRFFFSESWQSCLPLVALQYQDIEIRLYWGKDLQGKVYDVFANYIYLDSSERDLMTKNRLDMLVTQVQRTTPSMNKNQQLTLNHPVKFLVSPLSDWNSNTSLVNLQINGTDVTEPKPGSPHFTWVTQYYHSPYVGTKRAFLYPFCLDTSKLQPTGTLNFSRLDSTRVISTKMIDTNIYAVNYNILRIEKGQAGIMYSN